MLAKNSLVATTVYESCKNVACLYRLHKQGRLDSRGEMFLRRERIRMSGIVSKLRHIRHVMVFGGVLPC